MNALAAAAVDYAARGWPVLPLRGKVPRTRRGLHDATTEIDVIELWWYWWPTANVGLRTGDHFDVLDVDRPGAFELLDTRRPPDGTLPISGPVVHTSKGQHFYTAPTGVGNRAGVVLGADWRGRGGYVVAPPSRHPSGHIYRWAASPAASLPLVEPWLLRLLAGTTNKELAAKPRRATAANIAGLVAAVRASHVGTRNSCLHWAACRLADDIAAGRVGDPTGAARSLYHAGVENGLTDTEAIRTIRSALREVLGDRAQL